MSRFRVEDLVLSSIILNSQQGNTSLITLSCAFSRILVTALPGFPCTDSSGQIKPVEKLKPRRRRGDLNVLLPKILFMIIATEYLLTVFINRPMLLTPYKTAH